MQKVAATLLGRPRNTLFGQATPHPRLNLNTPHRLPARWSEAHATWHRCSVANIAWDPLASVGRMRTTLGFLLAAQTAQTFLSHVSLQVYRNPVSTKPLPPEVPIFSVMQCLHPTHIAVERVNGYHVNAESQGRSLRAVAFVVLTEKRRPSKTHSKCRRDRIYRRIRSKTSSRDRVSCVPNFGCENSGQCEQRPQPNGTFS